ncbi:MAG: C39 family peptidase [Anaerolineaceae bacterium]|nr:C39 family peptidase [Anaerolineaceae bacterium]
MQKRVLTALAALSVLTTISYALILNPTFQEKAGWHLSQWIIRARVWLHPPEEIAFSSETEAASTPGLLPNLSLENEAPIDDNLIETSHPTATFAPIPLTFEIAPGKYFSQHNRWNYCGPANIAMLLSMWGWDGTPDQAARVLKPYTLDKNVMPYEMAAYANQQPGLGAVVRVGGDLDTLKRLIAAGFPVIIEKGPHFHDIHYHLTWMGHYQVLNGYNDRGGFFIAQDSYIEANYHQPYDTLIGEWRSFNYVYLVVYPKQKENDVLNLLGDNADSTQNYRNALKKAQDELYDLEGVDHFFAYFNYGSNLVNLHDYEGAAQAYDQAFALYNALPEDITLRPYRILWYQTGPYFAYYYTGRYTDVIEKATANSIEMVRDDEPALEESYYWRGISKIAIGDKQGGIEDFTTCLKYHPGFTPCIEELNDQGIFP